jgi:hypothetical protein
MEHSALWNISPCKAKLPLRYKDVLGSGYVDVCFLDLGTSWSWVVSFTPGERVRGTYWIGGWVDPRARLDSEEKGTFLTLREL